MEAYQKSFRDIQNELGVFNQGLNKKQIDKYKQLFGKNEIISEKHESALFVFFDQFKDLLVIILIIAGVISAISGEFESTLVILVVITLNAVLGTYQTVKAQKSIDSLKRLSIPRVRVIREGKVQEINSDELVVGDIVKIEAGDIISGDGRLKEAINLEVDESALTGESNSVEKQLLPIEKKCTIGDMNNMVFSGSLVTNGTGQYIVTAVGMKSQLGKIAGMLNDTKQRKTPLQRTLDDFSVKLSVGIVSICIIVLLMNVFVAKEDILDSLMIAVALAVAAIPEALGSIVTIVLSISTQKMAKENAIIKNLNAVESLGCVSVICSDKTGTLTQNKMKVIDIYTNKKVISCRDLDHHQNSHNILLKAFILCNNATISFNQQIGDPTELALLNLYREYTNKHSFKLIASRQLELPFDSSRKLMSVTSKNHLYTKGAPDVLLKCCNRVLVDGYKEILSENERKRILKQNHEFASEGLRVIAIAYKEFYRNTLDKKDENDLIFVGLISLIDPPRKESREAVKNCLMAGIKPIMITGDHIITARSIARKIGIYNDGDQCLEGVQLEKLTNQELVDILPKVSVYARVIPEHKIRIVKAWQEYGQIVAMTGDGVNDAPALKQSDIGVAMGVTGSEVSKDAADMILTDDNFATIVQAIVTGRNVYTNIKNAIVYLLSGNLAAIICFLVTSFLILPTPFLPVHLLFINLITDSLPAIAIGMERGSKGILKQKPRGMNDSLLNRETLLQIGFEGLIICIFSMLAYFIGLKDSELLASSMAFGTLCLARLLHGFNCRSNLPLYKIPINYYSLGAFVIGTALLTWILISPNFHTFFSISELNLRHLAMIFVFATMPSIIIQIYKIISHKHI